MNLDKIKKSYVNFHEESIASTGSSVVKSLQKKGFEKLSSLTKPNRKNESWQYSSLSWFDLQKQSFINLNKSHRAPKIEQGLKEVDLVFFDGVFSLENSSGVCSSVLSIKF